MQAHYEAATLEHRLLRRVARLLLTIAAIVPSLSLFAQVLSIQLRIDDDSELLRQVVAHAKRGIAEQPERFRLVAETTTPDVIVSVGLKAFQRSLNDRGKTPLLALAIARPLYIQSVEAKGLTPETARDICGIFGGQSPRHNLALVRALMPEAKTLGGFSSRALPVRPPYLVLAREFSFNIFTEAVSSPTEALEALDRVLQKSDVLGATQVPDSTNSTNIRQIILTSLRAGKPVIGGANASFVDEGALGALFSTPENVWQEGLHRLNLYRNARTLGASDYSRQWVLAINRATATTLRLKLPSDDELRAEIKRLLGEE